MVSCGGLVTRLSAGYQLALSLPSCPTKEHLHAVKALEGPSDTFNFLDESPKMAPRCGPQSTVNGRTGLSPAHHSPCQIATLINADSTSRILLRLQASLVQAATDGCRKAELKARVAAE